MSTETNPVRPVMTDAEAAAEARQIIAAAYQPTAVRIEDPDIPSYEDGPRVGDAPPVAQPDSRLVPQWALGIAVASIGVGAGTVGLGCAAWLVCKGLSMVSVPGLERFAWIIIAPFAGATMLLTAVGGLISKAKKATTPEIHHHHGPEYHETSVDHRRAIWQKDVTKN